MVPFSTTAVVARNETWTGAFATEPYEASWSRELLAFITILDADFEGEVEISAQISPDGFRWVDEGTCVRMPARVQEIGFLRLSQFGTWVRLVGTLADGTNLKAMVTYHLK